MTIYQVENITTGKTNTTDCRELLANTLSLKGEYRVLVSRRYIIESVDGYSNGDGFYLELEDPSTEPVYTVGGRTNWTRDSYIDIENCIFCKENLVLETMKILDTGDTVKFVTDGVGCYIVIKGEYDITKVMLLITMMLVYSEVSWIESLEEFFSLGLKKIEEHNSKIEPIHYDSSRLSGILILYYLYKNKIKYKWDVYYGGLNWFPLQLYRKYIDDWGLFKTVTVGVIEEFGLHVTSYFKSSLTTENY